MSQSNHPPGRRLLRRKPVLEMTGVSNSTLHRWINANAFPKPVAIGPRSVAWWSDEVEAAMARFPRASVPSPNPKKGKAA